jgi:hypothetical protein
VMSGGRLECAFPLRTGMEYWVNPINPSFARERFREGMEILMQAWTQPGPTRYDGKFCQYNTSIRFRLHTRNLTPKSMSSVQGLRTRSTTPPRKGLATRRSSRLSRRSLSPSRTLGTRRCPSHSILHTGTRTRCHLSRDRARGRGHHAFFHVPVDRECSGATWWGASLRGYSSRYTQR